MDEKLKMKLEEIAASWDGSECDAVGETLDIGAQLRKQFAALAASPVAQPQGAKK